MARPILSRLAQRRARSILPMGSEAAFDRARLRAARALVRGWLRTRARAPEQGDALEALTRTYLARTFAGSAVAYD